MTGPLRSIVGRLLAAAALAGPALAAHATTVEVVHIAGAGYVDPTSVEPSANLARPVGIAMNQLVFSYVSDPEESIVYQMDPWAIASVLAGNGSPGFSGDGGPAAAARVNRPQGVAVDAAGNILIADTGNRRIRRIDFQASTIATVAGSDAPGLSGLGGPATAAGLRDPVAVAIGPAGYYIADADRILHVDSSGTIQRFAGGGSASPGAPGTGPADLRLSGPLGLAAGADGTVFVCDTGARRVFSIASSGVVTLIADATGINGFALTEPRGLAIEPDNGALYISDGDRVLEYAGGKVAPYAGTGQPGFIDQDLPALESPLDAPAGLAWDSFIGRLMVADTGNAFLRVVTDGTLHTFTRRGLGLNTDALASKIVWPEALAFDSQGRLLLTNPGHRVVWRVENRPDDDPPLQMAPVMGDGSLAPQEGAVASATGVGDPAGLAAAADGSVYISDRATHQVVRVGGDGKVARIAGTGAPGFSGDGGMGRIAQFNSPTGLVLDGTGTLYISDTANHRVRRLDPAGTITTVAGAGVPGSIGDGGPATAAALSAPTALALDGQGRLYIADAGDHRIRRVDGSGTISTAAGTGEAGFSGDGGPATGARLSAPGGVWVDGQGTLFISDSGNNRIRAVDSKGTITTVAGNGEAGYDPAGDYLPTDTRLNHPAGLVGSPAGDLLFADRNDMVIRSLTSIAAPLGAVAAGPPAAPPAHVVVGDANGDGILSVQDVILALQIAVGARTATPAQLAAADLNHDGRVDVGEVVRILRAAVGLESL